MRRGDRPKKPLAVDAILELVVACSNSTTGQHAVRLALAGNLVLQMEASCADDAASRTLEHLEIGTCVGRLKELRSGLAGRGTVPIVENAVRSLWDTVLGETRRRRGLELFQIREDVLVDPRGCGLDARLTRALRRAGQRFQDLKVVLYAGTGCYLMGPGSEVVASGSVGSVHAYEPTDGRVLRSAHNVDGVRCVHCDDRKFKSVAGIKRHAQHAPHVAAFVESVALAARWLNALASPEKVTAHERAKKVVDEEDTWASLQEAV